MKRSEEAIKIGDRTYIGVKFKSPELQSLILEWQQLGYCKHSGIEEQMEWSIMEVLLLEDFELRYVSTSGIEYPSLPYDNMVRVKQILATAKKARSFMKKFKQPDRKPDESLRAYLARVADNFEMHLNLNMEKSDASIAGDKFLARCISDAPLGYEE